MHLTYALDINVFDHDTDEFNLRKIHTTSSKSCLLELRFLGQKFCVFAIFTIITTVHVVTEICATVSIST